MANLAAEIASVESTMERLAQRRTTLRRKINALSPTAQLPTEILTEIFRLVCQRTEDDGRLITPLLFGGICKEWRDISWSTPLLWNTVCLHLSRTMHGSRVQLLREWLLRANTSPLYIKLTSDDEDEATFCSLHTIIETLVVRSTYWYSLDCLLPFQCHDLLRDHYFPMLKSVSVHPPKGTISTFSEPPNMFLSAPKLFDVDLSGYNFPAIVLPWEQLRRFKTQFLTVAECLKVLRRSPKIKECHLESVYSPEIIASPVSETLYSGLESLDLSLIKGSAISLLDSVTLPSLRELRVNYSGVGGLLMSATRSLVLRSGCDLRWLCIEKHNFHTDDLISCLKMIPSLTHLRLFSSGDATHTSMGLTESLVSMLDRSRHASPLLPNLTSLEYRGRVFCGLPAILALAESRHCFVAEHASGEEARALPRLCMLEITSTAHYDVPREAQETIARLRAAGMAISVCSITT